MPEPYSSEDILARDVEDALGTDYVKEVLAQEDESEWAAPEALVRGEEVTVRASAFTVSGASSITTAKTSLI